MERVKEMIASAADLAEFGQRVGVRLDAEQLSNMLGAADNETLMTDDKKRQDFVAAYSTVVAAIGTDKYWIFLRARRLAPLIASAQALLSFSAANARKVEDGTRDAIVAAQCALESSALSENHERNFLKAYEELSLALAPITAETLAVSRTVMPGWPPRTWLGRWSFGRFINVLIFMIALIGTCITLSYYAQGAAALKRISELKELIGKAAKELPERRAVLMSRAAVLEEVKAKTPVDAKEVEAASLAAVEAERELQRAMVDEGEATRERAAIPSRLEHWASRPCGESSNWFMSLLCVPTVPGKAALEKFPYDGEFVRIESARTVATRLSDVYLPLLLGWLGAHAFILRNMSKAITERSFAPGSAFNHIARIGLGALAGLASNWLLTPGSVGGAQWTNLPVWALAFVAGYGIELVFAFMDRIISAFTTKQ